MNIAAKGTEIKNGMRRSIIVKRQNFHLRKGLEDDIFENEICRCRAVNWKLRQDMLIIDMDLDKTDTTNHQDALLTEIISKNCITLINVQTEEEALVMKTSEGMNADVLRNLLPDCTLEWADPVSAKNLPCLFTCKESAPLKRPSDVIMTHIPDFATIESLDTIWVSPLDGTMKLVDGELVDGELDSNMGLVDLVFDLAPICPPSSASSSASSAKVLPSSSASSTDAPGADKRPQSCSRLLLKKLLPPIPQKGDSSTKIAKGGQQPKIPQNGESTKVSGSSTPTSAKSASPDASPAAMAPSTPKPETQRKGIRAPSTPEENWPKFEPRLVHDKEQGVTRWTKPARSNERLIAFDHFDGLAWETRHHEIQDHSELLSSPPHIVEKQNKRSPLATVSGDESQAPLRHPYDSPVSTASGDQFQFIRSPESQPSSASR